jgi:septal ring factor EnvC (AmiA/AmiB activator)
VSLAETELTIGGTSFKGVYIAILLSLATTLGGGVWTASSLYSRLEAVESQKIPDIAPLEEKILLVEQEHQANNVSQLQGKLSELGVNLVTIKDQQSSLLDIKTKVTDLDKDIETMKAQVTESKLIAEGVDGFSKSIKNIEREIEDLWSGMDYISNPLK